MKVQRLLVSTVLEVHLSIADDRSDQWMKGKRSQTHRWIVTNPVLTRQQDERENGETRRGSKGVDVMRGRARTGCQTET